MNPSDFFLDTITIDRRTPQLFDASQARIEKFCTAFGVVDCAPSVSFPQKDLDSIDTVSSKVQWPSTWIGEFVTLLDRDMVDTFRDQGFVYCRVSLI